MADDSDDSQKTEDPTQKRLDDARKEGKLPTSREVSHFVTLLMFSIAVLSWSPKILSDAVQQLSTFISKPDQISLSPGAMPQFAADILKHMLALLSFPLVLFVIAAFLSSVVQNGFSFFPSVIMPKASRISLTQGLSRMFSMQSVVEFLKGLFKISLVATVAVIAIKPLFPLLVGLANASPAALLDVSYQLAKRVLIGATIVIGALMFLDVVYQRIHFHNSLRMSRHDIREEYKQTEGSPEVKSKLKELRAKRAKTRMMQAVPSADVIITNPTHFALALSYDMNTMPAPKVIAKGQDLIALKIREIAKANNVPIVENPPLARALFKSVEVDEEIPLEHYQAVAEIIRYVFGLKGKLKKA